MKKFTKISLIVTAVMLGVGIIFCGIASMMGVGFLTMRQMAQAGEFDTGNWHIRGDGIYYADEGADWDINTSDTESPAGTDEIDASYDIASVKNIIFDVDAAGIYVRESDDESTVSVALTQGKEKYYACNLEGDTLKIEYKYHGNYPINEVGPRIEVCLPGNAAFKDVSMNIGAAEIIFEDAALTCENLTVDVGAGSVEAEWFEVTDQTEISIGAGEVVIDDGTFNDMILDCAMGNIKMDGTLKGNLKGSCSMGEMKINLSGNREDYNYKLSCSMGELKINGEKYSGFDGEHNEKNPEAIGTIELDCSMGNVKLDID